MSGLRRARRPCVCGRFGYPNRAAYSTTKWGLVGFTKTLALELGQYGITANPHRDRGRPPLPERYSGRVELSGRTMNDELAEALAIQRVKSLVDPCRHRRAVLFLSGPHSRSISG